VAIPAGELRTKRAADADVDVDARVSAAPSANLGGGFPTGCAPVDLLGPDGDAVDLTGEWSTNPEFSSTGAVYLNQIGGCLFGSYQDSYVGGFSQDEASIATLNGTLHSDFTVDVDLVFVFQDPLPVFAEFSRMAMNIEWDDEGRIRLREVREPGMRAGRCVEVIIECPSITLTKVEGE
jgi:hypothetical protein